LLPMITPKGTPPQIPNLDKVGNLIIYLVDQVQKKHRKPVHVTRLLKLLFIIDETSVKETGVPVTGLDYRVWKMGPVAYAVYADLARNNAEQLGSFAEAKSGEGESKKIESTNRFDDAEFSDYEMSLIDTVVDKYGAFDGNALVELLHEEGSLWEKIVDEKELAQKFETEATGPFKIDLRALIADDPQKLELYNTAQESFNL
jgi:uncharacterized phage-associated protein